MIVRTSTYRRNKLLGMLRRLARVMSAGLPCCRPLAVTMMGRRTA